MAYTMFTCYVTQITFHFILVKNNKRTTNNCYDVLVNILLISNDVLLKIKCENNKTLLLAIVENKIYFI